MEVIKYTPINSDGKIKGYLTIKTSEGFEMKGFKLIEGENGLFVGAPSQKGKDEQWYDMVWIPKELNQELVDLASNQIDLSNAVNSNDIPF